MAGSLNNERLLRPKEALIIAALREASRPLGAYDLMDVLRDAGVSSPPTVYRALRRLTQTGLVHRIESLNAFVACAQGNHCHRAGVACAICTECGAVEEFYSRTMTSCLAEWSADRDFTIQQTTIELRGRCRDCAVP